MITIKKRFVIAEKSGQAIFVSIADLPVHEIL